MIKEDVKEYICHYGHRFLGKDVVLVPFTNESKELIGNILFAKSLDDTYFSGGRPTEGYLLSCPVCGNIQFGGFSCPTDKQIVVQRAPEPKRKLQLSF